MTAILIVDDSQAVRMDLADTLETAGFRVHACGTATDARIALRTYSFALALVGARLPDGAGFELVEQVRREHVLSELPILMLASWDDFPANGLLEPRDFVGKPPDRGRVL